MHVEDSAAGRPQASHGSTPLSDRLQVNISWILKLRWAAAIGQLLTVVIVGWGLAVRLPWPPLLVIIGAEAASNVALGIWIRQREGRTEPTTNRAQDEGLLTSVMLVDVLLLSGLLYYTGGPFNPFSIFYLINVALAAVVLRPFRAWLLAAVTLACYSSLYLVHRPLEPLESVLREAIRGRQLGDRWNALDLLVAGLWVGFAGATTVIVYFITRVTVELARRDAEWNRAEQQRAHAQRVEALGTLAAGAAHELATPLSTIAVAARELELAIADGDAVHPAAEDVRLIRQEVDRCRGILNLMSANAGQGDGEPVEKLSAEQLVSAALADWPAADRIDIVWSTGSSNVLLLVPAQSLGQALRAIIQNGLDASPDGGRIACRVSHSPGRLEFAITDQGTGMPEHVLARATDPFFTTKDPGKGMGLGLFLTRSIVARLGGELRLESVPGRGSTVHISLPIA